MLLPGREGPEERHGGNAEQPEQSPPPAHGRLLTSLWGARHLQPPLSTAPPTVPSFARVVRVREGPREYLADAHLLRQLPGAGVKGHGQRALLGPRVGDQEPQQEPLGLRPVTQRGQDLTILLGHHVPLLERHPTRHPVQLEEVRYLRLVLQQTPPHLDPLRHLDPALSTTQPTLTRQARKPPLLGLPQ